MKITVVGLGSGDINSISLGAYNKLIKSENIFMRTGKHPICDQLLDSGISFKTFDELYDTGKDFDSVYMNIIEMLISEVKAKGEIIYAVPGHPRVAETSVDMLLSDSRVKKQNIEIDIISSNSFLDDMFVFLNMDPVKDGFVFMDALKFDIEILKIKSDFVFAQVYSRYIASELKLSLLEYLSDEVEVIVFKAAGIKDKEEKRIVKLHELDMCGFEFDHLTSIYIPYRDGSKKFHTLKDLTDIIAVLRSEKGCPWDKKQDSLTIMNNIEDEVIELRQAIQNEDIDNIIEEAGDILMLLCMQAQFGDEQEFFNMNDIIDGIVKKLVFRHPYVFGNETATSIDDANKIWEQQKKREKEEKA